MDKPKVVFVPTADFECKELNSHYLKDLGYAIRSHYSDEDYCRLAEFVEKWKAEGLVVTGEEAKRIIDAQHGAASVTGSGVVG